MESTRVTVDSDNTDLATKNHKFLSAQHELEELRTRYAEIYDFAPIGYLTLGTDGLVLEANLAAARYLGVERSDLIGTAFSHYVASEDRKQFRSYWHDVLENSEQLTCELKLESVPPTCVRLQGKATKLPGDGVVCRVAMSDISGSKHEEEAREFLSKASALLAESLDYHTTLSNIASLCVPYLADWCVVDIAEDDGPLQRLVVTHVDPAKAELAAELERLYPPPPDADHIVSKVVRTGEPDVNPNVTDDVLVAAARDERHLEILRGLGVKAHMIVPMFARERALGAITFGSAESGRNYGPEDLKIALDLASRAAIAVDNARLYRLAQEAAERDRHHATQLKGLTRAGLTINSSLTVEAVLDAITEQARELIGAHQAVTGIPADETWARSTSSVSLSDKYSAWREYKQRPTGSGIYGLVTGTNRPMRLTQDELEAHPMWSGFGEEAGKHPPMRGWLAAPLTDRDGRNIGLIQLSDKYEGEFTEADEAIVVHLAQMASIAINNASLYQETEEAVKARDEFISIASHELRTPITSLTLQLQTLVRAAQRDALANLPPGQALSRLEAAQGQIKRLAKLVNELLDLSRITEGHLELNLEEVELAGVVREVLHRFEEEVRLSNCTPVVDLDDSVIGLWDRFRLDQIVANLLSNAIKYGRGKPIQVFVEKSADGEKACLTVRDYGIGIAPDNLDRIFVRFQRAVSARNYSGLGLGLYIVRRILDALGGSIRVESELGKGTTFTVELPLNPQE